MEFIIFYKKWITIIFKGWIFIFRMFISFLIEIKRKLHFPFWSLVFTSILLILLVIIPWFSYQIELEEIETIYIRTKKWYIFIIPTISSLIFIWIYHKRIYSFQLFINIIIIILFSFSIFYKSYHVELQGDYKTNIFFYLYFIVLCIHTFTIQALKRKENFIYNVIIDIWNQKKRKKI